MQPIDDTDQIDELAPILGMTATAFAQSFGAAWHLAPGPTPHDFDSDPSGGLDAEVTPWHVSGTPPQLMIRVFHHGVFLALPDGSWAGGTHDLRYWPDRQTYVPLQAVTSPETEALVRGLLRRRRKTFRYCRYCRTSTPPELQTGDSCMSCATEWEGVVY